MIKLSIIFPCYNEAENIPTLINDCKKYLCKYKSELEIVLVNNGSKDNTKKIFDKLLQESDFFKVVNIKKNQGYGYGILKGLSVAKGKYIGWMHADLQTDPKDIIKVLNIIGNTENLYIKGKRKNRAITDNFFTVLMSLLCSLVFRKIIFDINAQPNIFPKEFFDSWINPPKHFGLDTFCYCMAIKKKLRIIKFEVFFGKRTAGEAHLYSFSSKISYSINALKYIFELKRNINKK